MMGNIKGIFIDESCHLENDNYPVMCVGYIKINLAKREELSEKIKQLKIKHHTPTELKWNTVSHSRMLFYKELIDFFFENEITFRALLIKRKELINNSQYNDSNHNIFYYKSMFYLLRTNTAHNEQSRVFFDIKDYWGKERLITLSKVLGRVYGADRFLSFQDIRSHENQLIQLCDFFIGAIVYKARNDIQKNSKVKISIVEYIESKLGYNIDEGTPPWETKFDVFDFQLKSK